MSLLGASEESLWANLLGAKKAKNRGLTKVLTVAFTACWSSLTRLISIHVAIMDINARISILSLLCVSWQCYQNTQSFIIGVFGISPRPRITKAGPYLIRSSRLDERWEGRQFVDIHSARIECEPSLLSIIWIINLKSFQSISSFRWISRREVRANSVQRFELKQCASEGRKSLIDSCWTNNDHDHQFTEQVGVLR